MSLARPPKEELADWPKEQLAALAADCLASLEPGRQPLDLFTQLARLVTTSTVEILPIKKEADGDISVLLTQRPATDPWWANQWHIPGVILLPGEDILNEQDYYTPTKRMLEDETKGGVAISGAVEFVHPMRRRSSRGDEQTVLGWAEVEVVNADVLPSDARFFNPNQLASGGVELDLVVGHAANIRAAVEHYVAQAS